MSTIAKDYAAELRRISATLFEAGRVDDADELRLAAQYIEQRAKGVALDDEEIEERLSARELRIAAELAEALLTKQSAALCEQSEMDPNNQDTFLDFLANCYLNAAAIVAVTSLRSGGPLSYDDFLATTAKVWFAAVLQDAVSQSQIEGGRAS